MGLIYLKENTFNYLYPFEKRFLPHEEPQHSDHWATLREIKKIKGRFRIGGELGYFRNGRLKNAHTVKMFKVVWDTSVMMYFFLKYTMTIINLNSIILFYLQKYWCLNGSWVS